MLKTQHNVMPNRFRRQDYLFSSADTPKAYNNAIGMKNASQLFNESFISPRNVSKKSAVTHRQFLNIWFLEKCTMLKDIVESHIYYL